jgi:integrase
MPSTTARPRTSSSSTRIDTTVLFPTPTGRIWWERNFYRDVWQPAREASGLDCTPHDFRHSWVTHLRAAGIDAADLAEIAGHTVATATDRYTHPLRRSDDAVRDVVG